MCKRAFLFLTMIAVLTLVSSLSAGSVITIRPYARIGTVLNKVSAEDLEYVGENLDEHLDLSKTNYGFGGQLLLGTGVPAVSMGLDIGFQKLLDYEFDTGAAAISAAEDDLDKADEWDSYLLLVAEMSPPVLPIFLQAGAGPHFVFWDVEEIRDVAGGETSISNSDVDVGFGFMGAVGMNLKAAPTISIPIMIRVDYLTRHGGQAAIGAMVGLSLSI